jgi:hypothetical protein
MTFPEGVRSVRATPTESFMASGPINDFWSFAAQARRMRKIVMMARGSVTLREVLR